MNQCTVQTRYKIIKQRDQKGNFGYCKVGRAMTKWRAIQKSSIVIAIQENG